MKNKNRVEIRQNRKSKTKRVTIKKKLSATAKPSFPTPFFS